MGSFLNKCICYNDNIVPASIIKDDDMDNITSNNRKSSAISLLVNNSGDSNIIKPNIKLLGNNSDNSKII